ncbi:MAG: methyltransferase domain-containing protein [Deltaproteobacteria bacterium]|nr:methyltransferase domain-containing protein [Deltaproteobacteria bacterium]
MALMIKQGGKRVDLFSFMTPGKILDFPAGEGKESNDLLEMGFRVIAADLFRPKENARPEYVLADGNTVFPFRAVAFDYVLSREGIEHLENQAQFLRECARVLKTGGKLVLTTPNVLHLNGRVSWLLTGQRILKRGLINEVQTVRKIDNGKIYHGHAFLIDYFRLRYLLRLSGFDGIEVYTDRYSLSSIIFLWLVPLLFTAALLSVRMSMTKDRKKRKFYAYKPPFKEILTHVFSPALLFGKRMMVVAEKRT